MGPSKPTTITTDESGYVAEKILVDNCQTAGQCEVNLNGSTWSAQVLDQGGNLIDQVTASATTVTVEDMSDNGFKKDDDDPDAGKGYYHDPPNNDNGPILIGSLVVTVGNASPQTILCPQTNCLVIVQYCQGGSPDPVHKYKCK